MLPALFAGCAANGKIQSIETLGNATYSGIYEFPVSLNNGRWEGELFIKGATSRPVVWLDDGIYLSGDLDDDGLDEFAVILWENSGGTGIHSYLAVMGRQEGQIVNLATAYIGDRIQVKNGRFENGEIVLNIIQHGEGDGACCPTQKATVSWSLSDLLEK